MGDKLDELKRLADTVPLGGDVPRRNCVPADTGDRWADLRRLAGEATGGEWSYTIQNPDRHPSYDAVYCVPEIWDTGMYGEHAQTGIASEADAAFIAAAANAIAPLLAERDGLARMVGQYHRSLSELDHEICQTLGKALGYPWLKDDRANFPDATEADGVCVGEHIAETLASEAADRIRELTHSRDEARAECERLRAELATTQAALGDANDAEQQLIDDADAVRRHLKAERDTVDRLRARVAELEGALGGQS